MPNPFNFLISSSTPYVRLAAFLLMATSIHADSVPFALQIYKQEFARTYTVAEGLDSNQVREIHCDS